MTAVEIDARLIPVLEAVLGALPVRVVQGDALRLDWADLLGPDPGWVLVANLPYNIATPLVAALLDDVPVVERMVIMVQREVGERLVALPGHREYGAVSVKVAYWAEASVVGHVPPTVFVPRPKVESALVSIRRRPAPAVDPARVDPELLFRLVRAGFAKRRKMLRRSLAGLASPAAFEAAEVRPDSRAENLDVYAWGRLAAAVAAAAEPGSGSGSGSGSPDPGSAAADRGSGSGSGSPDPGSAAADPGSGSGSTGADPGSVAADPGSGSGSGSGSPDPGSAAADPGWGSGSRSPGADPGSGSADPGSRSPDPGSGRRIRVRGRRRVRPLAPHRGPWLATTFRPTRSPAPEPIGPTIPEPIGPRTPKPSRVPAHPASPTRHPIPIPASSTTSGRAGRRWRQSTPWPS